LVPAGLAPYADPHLAAAGGLVDVLPEVAARAVDLLPADQAAARLDLVRPPMRWLVDVAVDLDGRLVGSVYRGFVGFNGVQFGAAVARTLAERIDRACPATGESPAALPAATAEGWSGWSADRPLWTGGGADLLERPLAWRW
jgi:hypothetical protein